MLTQRLSSLVTQVIVGEDKIIKGIALDSRKVEKDFLFVALKGDSMDGHQYISQAIAKGAIAVVLENEAFINAGNVSYVHVPSLKQELGHIAARFYRNPTETMSVIGVTGTNGKTSITHYIAEILQLLGKDCAVIGTLGISYKNTSIPTSNTTPDAITLQRAFHEMSVQGIRDVAMEVSSHALEQYRCDGIAFNIAIISNITHDHLDYHGTFQAYEQAKMKLFSRPELSVAIVNADDQSAEKIRYLLGSSVKLVSYSAGSEKADVYLSNIKSNPVGYFATLNYSGQQYFFKVNLLGEFNLYNILASIIAVAERGYSIEEILNVLPQVKPVSGRMQLVPNNYNIVALVDYAHTPDALENVLKTLRKQVIGNIIVVFGCGGDRDSQKRPKMAAIAEKNADYVIITADNPRTESLEKILDNISSGMKGKQYTVIPQRDEAIAFAVNKAAANDCILVAGKGHEKTQIIGNVIKPFDDVAVLEAALKNRQVATC